MVEDDPMYSGLLTEKLGNIINVEVKTFNNGESCLQNISRKPDVILLDYYLPGMNGLETFKEIKRVHPEISVIFMSSQQDVNVALDSLKEGAFGYIVKDKNALPILFDYIKKASDQKNIREELITLRLQLRVNKVKMTVVIMVVISLLILNLLLYYNFTVQA